MITTTILGRLGADPETKTTPSGHSVTEARVASTSKRGGEEVTTWVRCAIWGARGEAFARFHSKGQRVFLTGELVNRSYQKDGETRYSLELDVSGWDFAQGRDESSEPAPSRSGGSSYGGGRSVRSGADDGDDIPFVSCSVLDDPNPAIRLLVS